MPFWLRNLLADLLQPVPVVLALAAVGVLLWARGRRRAARGLVAAAFLLLWASSCTPLGVWAVASLEDAHPAFPGDSVSAVLVLGGGHASDPDVPLSAVPSGSSLYRIVEGVRIAEAQPWAEVWFSSFGGPDPRSTAEVGADLARALGVDAARLNADPRPRTTAEEAELLAPRLRGRRFALVTSATHMPRAVRLFRARGLDPVPAPTGHRAKNAGRTGPRDWLVPSVDGVTLMSVAWYEWISTTWAWLVGDL